MKRKSFKITSIILCACLIFTNIGSFACADFGGKQMETAAVQPSAKAKLTAVSGDASKDETVYVLAGADGSVQKIIVSDRLANPSAASSITDVTELTDIETVKGDIDFTEGDGNTRVWNAGGKDVYYQGNTDKDLPVSVKVSYWLDGRLVTGRELAGKSGQVTIRFDYENRQYETVEINGEKVKIYVPFAMITGLILDNETFTNVEVTNGRAINDGDRTIAVGYAFPGMQESLDLDRETFEVPDYVEIRADVTDFSLGMTVTLASNELFSEYDSDSIQSLDELSDSLDELTDAMDQLMDGSSQLYDGLDTLLSKSGELVSGINKLADGAKQLKNGASDLDLGASQLQSGAAQLYTGLKTLDSNSDTLNSGAEQVFTTLLSTAQTQLNAAGLEVRALTISNYAQVLNGVIASLDESAVYAKALETVTAAVEAKRDYIRQQVTAAVYAEVESGVTAAVRAEVEAKVTAAVREQIRPQVEEAVRQSVTEQVIYAVTGMDQAKYNDAVKAGLIDEATQTAINAAVEEKMMSDEIQAVIEQKIEEQLASDSVRSAIAANTDEQMASDEIKALISATVAEREGTEEIKALIEQNVETQVQAAIAENMASEAVQTQLASASEGAKQVISLKASLDSFNAFYLGLKSYTAGVSQATAGAYELKTGVDSLKTGSGTLSAGLDSLYSGSQTLKNSMPALTDGIGQLRDGAKKLSDGLEQFNEEGVQKLVDAVNGDLSGLLDRVNAMLDAAESYSNFSGIADGMEGQVKFIWRTEEIGQ